MAFLPPFSFSSFVTFCVKNQFKVKEGTQASREGGSNVALLAIREEAGTS